MRRFTALSAAACLLTIAGVPYAACYVDGNATATNVQINSGQGGFTCETSVIATDGRLVTDLYQGGNGVVDVFSGQINKTLGWEIKPGMLPEGQTYPVYLVRVVNSGEGSSCNYNYDGLTASDNNLGNTDAGQVRQDQTLVCGSLQPVTLPVEEPQPDIVTTQGDGCTVTVTYNDGSGSTTVSPAVTDFFTYGLDAQGNDLEQYGVCAGEDLGNQFECIGEDKTIAREVPSDCPIYLEDGSIDGACAPIETDQRVTTPVGLTIQPCWNFVNRWCGEGDTGQECVDRILPSFDPRTLVRETASTTQVWQGSPYCYLTQKLVRGVLKDYWVCIEF